MTMKRSITSTVAATMVLGSMFAPSAMANNNPGYSMGKKAIYLNGTLVSQPIGLTAKDRNTHRATTYMPIWYILQALKSVGVQYTWDSRDLNIIPAPGMTVKLDNLPPGNEDTRLLINGTLVDTAYRIVAQDPYSGVDTTYIPIWYVQYVLGQMGVVGTWNGTNWNMAVSVNSIQKLNISATSQTVATGQPDKLTVTATYKDGSTVALTPDQIHWSTNDTDNAFVSPSQQFVATKPGTYTVTATSHGVSQTFQIQVYGSTAAVQLKPGGDLVADGSSTQTVTVNALDSSGAIAQGENGTMVVSSNQPWLVSGTSNGANTLTKSVTVQLKNGVGTVEMQAPSTPGLTANLSVSNLSDAQSGLNIQYGTMSMTSVPQVATSLTVSPVNGQQYLEANQSGNTASFDVTVNDQEGKPMLSGYYAYNIAVSGNATYNGPSTAIFIPGQTRSPITVESKQGAVGPVTVTVTGNGLKAASSTIQAVIAKEASKLIATAPQGATSFAEGSSITYTLTAQDEGGVPTTFPSTPLMVHVTNQQGEPASNILVNRVPASAGGVALNASHSITLSDDNRHADAGNYNVQIKDSAGNVWGSFQVTETAAAAQKLVLSSSATELTVANPGTPVTAQFTDAYGNASTPSGQEPLTLTAVGGQGAATINGQDATKGVQLTPDEGGKATATFTAQPYAGSTWKLTASGAKLKSNTISISVLNAVVRQAEVSLKDASTGSTSQATAGDALQVSFGAIDSYNNPYSGNDSFVVTFPSTGLQGIVGGTASDGVTTVSGTLSQLAADFRNARVANAQTLTLKIADQSVSNAASGSASISVIPGPFKGFAVFDSQNEVISSANPLQVTGGTPPEVWVRPVDAMNNQVSISPAGYSVDLLSNSGSGAFRLSPSGSDIRQVTFPIGTASEPVYYVNQNGSYVLAAVISTLNPSRSTVSINNYKAYQSSPVANGTGTLTVVLRDDNNLPVSGQASNLSAAASVGDVSVGSFTQSTTSPGVYTAPITATAKHSGVTIKVKDGSTTVGSTPSFNS